MHELLSYYARKVPWASTHFLDEGDDTPMFKYPSVPAARRTEFVYSPKVVGARTSLPVYLNPPNADYPSEKENTNQIVKLFPAPQEEQVGDALLPFSSPSTETGVLEVNICAIPGISANV